MQRRALSSIKILVKNVTFKLTVLTVGILLTTAACQHPSEAGSTDPHGPYSAEEARAAGMAALKQRGAGGRTPGKPATPSTSPTTDAAGSTAPKTGN
jgi:hypothetical protein